MDGMLLSRGGAESGQAAKWLRNGHWAEAGEVENHTPNPQQQWPCMRACKDAKETDSPAQSAGRNGRPEKRGLCKPMSGSYPNRTNRTNERGRLQKNSHTVSDALVAPNLQAARCSLAPIESTRPCTLDNC